MTPAFAQSLADIRLRQTAGLMEWMAQNCPDREAIVHALEAVNSARDIIRGLPLPEDEAGVAAG